MKKIKNFFFVYLVLSLISISNNSVIGQELPSLKRVTIKSNISLIEGIYSYSYTVTSNTGNIGDIYGIDIDISKPQNGTNLSGEGLINGPGFLKNTSASVLQITKIQMIPVGLSAPPIWVVGLGIDGTVGWGGSDTALLLPGQSLSGFLITSRGLPGIRAFRADPFIDIDTLSDEILPPDDIEAATQLTESLAFLGKTIGPTAPPADFKPVDFLNYIISLKHEAYNLGWIVQGRDDDKGKREDDEKGIMKSLDKKLEKAKAELVKGDTKEAVEKLKSFIHEVEALYKEDKDDKHNKEKEGHSHITSEAYALLKYNTIYLIEQLGGKVEEKEHNKD